MDVIPIVTSNLKPYLRDKRERERSAKLLAVASEAMTERLWKSKFTTSEEQHWRFHTVRKIDFTKIVNPSH